MTDTVYIICPGNTTTGGPEVCHQLAHQLNNGGQRAFIVYFPFDRPFEVPEAYRGYNVHPARLGDVNPGSTVVLPEVYGDYIPWFRACRIYFWWLSVGNFVSSAGVRASDQIDMMRRYVAQHLYQSEHARLFLQSMLLTPAARLSDCLSDGYIAAIADPPAAQRHNLLLYNPAKGAQRAEAVLAELKRRGTPDYSIIPLRGFNASQMRLLLARSKVYIDFGEHPGKDRIPREAAAMGACVLTNRRGSAGNPVDVPIPGDLKIKDRKPGFERRAADKIQALIDGYDHQAPRLDAYRNRIAAEPQQFADDARAIFEKAQVHA